MFSFFKTKSKINLPKAPKLVVDLHSHLIPGIDDGAQSIEESLTLLAGLQALGYTKVITTPHIMIDAYGNTKASILESLEILKNKSQEHSINISIDAAAEYYLDEGLLPLIKKKELLLINDTYLLFETSYNHRPKQLEETIFDILASGYTPLLAHPERYNYIQHIDEYHALKEIGAYFQVNINSFNGYYGSHAKEHAHALSQHGLIDFLGSDTHHQKHLDNLSIVLKSDSYKEVYLHNTIHNPMLI